MKFFKPTPYIDDFKRSSSSFLVSFKGLKQRFILNLLLGFSKQIPFTEHDEK